MRVPVQAMVAAGIVVAASGGLAHAASGAAPAAPCRAAELTATLEDTGMYAGSGGYFEEVRLAVTNKATGACLLDGAPGVVLAGPQSRSWAASFEVPATGDAPDNVSLAPGGTAHATVWVRVVPDAEDAWEPTELRVRLAGGAVTAAWPEGLAITQATTPLSGTDLPNSVGPLTPQA